MSNAIFTIVLLILSNIFMTLAWYGHLKFLNNVIMLLGYNDKLDDSIFRVLPANAGKSHRLR